CTCSNFSLFLSEAMRPIFRFRHFKGQLLLIGILFLGSVSLVAAEEFSVQPSTGAFRLTVPAYFDEQGPYEFLLDTGAEVAFLDQSLEGDQEALPIPVDASIGPKGIVRDLRGFFNP